MGTGTQEAQGEHKKHKISCAFCVPLALLVFLSPQLELLERPLPLRMGIGAAHDAVSTSSPQAQAFYDQGLAYLHSYEWIEAARSFNQALRLDPKLALAHVGLSRAYSGLEDGPAARAAMKKAEAVSSGGSEKERRKIALRK